MTCCKACGKTVGEEDEVGVVALVEGIEIVCEGCWWWLAALLTPVVH